jgi:hypothetical protein
MVSKGGIGMAENPRVYRPKKYTDTFKRKTINIEEPLLEKLQELASNRKGEQTRIVNAALDQYFARHNGYIEDMDRDVPWLNKSFYLEEKMRNKMISVADGRGRQQNIFNTAIRLYLADPENVKRHTVEDWYVKPENFWKNIRIQRQDEV